MAPNIIVGDAMEDTKKKPEMHRNLKGTSFIIGPKNAMTEKDKDASSLTGRGCHRPWPDLEIVVPVALLPLENPRKFEWREIFFKSFLFFWPLKRSQTKLRFIVDDNVAQNLTVSFLADVKAAEIKWGKNKDGESKISGGISVSQSKFNSTSYYHNKGHTRQQLLMFWADLYSASEYIGFADTDCFFITYVDREDLFENGKPVINGRLGKPQNGFWASVPTSTKWLMKGLPEPMRCMSYFPVIIKRSHLKDMRLFFETVHNQSFNEIFEEYSRNEFSQFGAMCAWLWWFKRDEYVWYVHDASPDWNLKDPFYLNDENPKFILSGHVQEKSVFTPSMFTAKPRIALHSNYHIGLPIGEVALKGFCHSPPFPKSISSTAKGILNSCHDIKPTTSLFKEMFSFEETNWFDIYNETQMLEQQSIRYERLNTCSKEWDFRIAPWPNDLNK